jgi:3-hydroxybutyryl-CoA dehydrogenase
MEIKKVCVVGSGIMASGIAQVVAAAGFDVSMVRLVHGNAPADPKAFAQKGPAAVRKSLDRLVSKGKMEAAEASAIVARISATVSLEEGAGNADLVIGSIVEEVQPKIDVYKVLDKICPPSTLFCTNTSGISITELASVTKRPDKFIGMHFFNPAPVMKLVELIRGLATSDETFATAKAFAEKTGKEPVEVKEAPGFAVNRILCPMINEGILVYSAGIASAEDVDKAMMLGANHPIGPLALADMIGLDTLLLILERLQSELGEDKYHPAPLLRKMVRAGYLGRKSGKGFFDYNAASKPLAAAAGAGR